MTVKELIEILQNLPPDNKVIISSDQEGNSFSYMSDDYSVGYFIEDKHLYGDFYDKKDIEENPDDFEDSDLIPAICLWP